MQRTDQRVVVSAGAKARLFVAEGERVRTDPEGSGLIAPGVQPLSSTPRSGTDAWLSACPYWRHGRTVIVCQLAVRALREGSEGAQSALSVSVMSV